MHPLLKFYDETLLQQALTSAAAAPTSSEKQKNERLEFLGNAILCFLCSEYLCLRFPDLKEDDLTRYRTFLVDKSQLADFAESIGLADEIPLDDGETSGHTKLLSSTFKAIVGAYYLDRRQQIDLLRPLIHELFTDVPPDVIFKRSMNLLKSRQQELPKPKPEKHPKNLLQEIAQLKFETLPRYVTKRIGGSDHEPIYRSRVFIGEKVIGEGRGGSKETAGTQAAENALKRIEEGL